MKPNVLKPKTLIENDRRKWAKEKLLLVFIDWNLKCNFFILLKSRCILIVLQYLRGAYLEKNI